MSRIDLTPWNLIPGKPEFKTVAGQSIFGSGDITINGGVPYTGATQTLDMGLYDIQATRFKFGSTGPQLDNSGGTIRARTNDGLADAPFSASQFNFGASGPILKPLTGNVLATVGDGGLKVCNGAETGYSAVNAGLIRSYGGGLWINENGSDAYGITGSGNNLNFDAWTSHRFRLQNQTYTPLTLTATTATFGGNVTVGTFPAISTGPINVKSDGKGDCLVLANSATEYTRFVSGGIYKGLLGQGSVPLVLSSSNVRLMSDSTIAFRNVADTADASMSCANVTANGTTVAGDATLSTLNSSKLRFGGAGTSYITAQSTGLLIYEAPWAGGSASHYFRENGTAYLQISGGLAEIQGTRAYCLSSGGSHVVDIALYRLDANTLEINNRTAGTQRDLKLRALTASGIISCGMYMTAPAGFYSIASGGNAMGYDFDFLSSLKKHVLAGPYGAVFICFGGTTSSFPAIKRSGTTLQIRLADDTAYAPIKQGFTSLAADPSTLDLDSGSASIYKNTTSGALKLWANDGGTMKSVALT